MAYYDRDNDMFYVNFTYAPTSQIYMTQLGLCHAHKGYHFIKRNMVRHLFDYVVSGKGYVRYRDRDYTVSAGDLLFLRKGIDCEYGADNVSPYKKLWFAADGDVLTAMIDAYLGKDEIIICHNADIEPFLTLKSIIASEGYNEQRILHAIFDVIWTLSSRPLLTSAAETLSLPEKIRVYIDNRVTEHFSLDEMAAYFHLSERHLIRVFKAFYRQTPGAYYNERRMKAAARFLLETEYTVSEISAALGFCDTSFFSAAFKRFYGVSPREYRNAPTE